MYETIDRSGRGGKAGRPRQEAGAQPRPGTAFSGLWDIDARRVLAWVRGGTRLIAILSLLCGTLGLAYAVVGKPKYTADATVLIDPSNLQVVPDDLYAQSAQRDSQLLEVESMMRVMTSGNTLSRVVKALDLTSDPEFVKPGAGLSGLVGGADDDRDPAVIALDALAKRVTAKRADGSFVVDVAAWADNPEKSASLVNAVLVAFQAELAQEEADGAGRSAKALSDRLSQLKDNVRAAEDKVEAFRRAHNLQASNGELISAQSMTQLNAQVLDAQNRLIQAQSRYKQLASQGVTGANTDALQSATLTALRTQYATLKQQYDSAALTLGPRHPTLLALKPQLAALEQQIAAESKRIIDAAATDVASAKADLATLTAKSQGMQGTVSTDNQAQVQLRELQREADSATAIYNAYLNRASQVTEREQINTTNVRVISPPTEPTQRSWPPSPILATIAGLVLGAVFGLVLAGAIGLWRDYRWLSRAELVA
jgi:uncharacterized protein involved in exopolysaccharide biosynthesis